MTATEDAIALLRSRVTTQRIGKMAWREMDQDILAMRKVIELLEAPPTEDERREFAEFLDDLHDDYVTEGGCDFRAVIHGWRIGETPRLSERIVDPILERARR